MASYKLTDVTDSTAHTGDIPIFKGTNLSVFRNPNTSGKFLRSNGPNQFPSWETITPSGDSFVSEVEDTSTIDLTVFNGKLTADFVSTLISQFTNDAGYITSSTGVPSTRTITINGTTFDLSANRTWSVGTVTSVDGTAGTGINISGGPIITSGSLTITNTAPDQIVVLTAGAGINTSGTYPNFTITNISPSSGGTVTSIATTSPITGGTITSTGTIAITQSTTSTDGYLSSIDWNIFNNKQSTLTIGNLTDVGTDGIVITNGSSSVIGSGTSIAQHVADSTHNGYLSSIDWSTFNGKSTVTPAALTKIDDTNITLTLGGSPTTSLLQGTSITAGWSGTLADARLSTTAVTPASYGSATTTPTFTVGATGRLTTAANVTITPAASSITGGTALTKTDDTNVTLTLGGAPTTALLTASSLTLGWIGTLANSRGGTGTGTYTTGDILYASATNTLSKLSIGSTGNLLTVAGGIPSWAAPATNGTVTSVALSLPSFITISGSPVTTSGTLTGTLATQITNTVFSGPISGSAAAPTFRTLVPADIPNELSKGSVWDWYQDFEGNFTVATSASTSTLPGFAVFNGAGASVASLTTTANDGIHVGVSRITLSTVTSSTCFFGTTAGSADNTSIISFGNGAAYYEALVRIPTLSTGTQRYIHYIGFLNSSNPAVNGAYFSYSDSLNSGAWTINTVTNTTTSSVNTASTPAVNTWYRLRIEVNAAATSAIFYVNGVQVGTTITTNIPTGTHLFGAGLFSAKTIGNTSITVLDVDYLWAHIDFTTSR